MRKRKFEDVSFSTRLLKGFIIRVLIFSIILFSVLPFLKTEINKFAQNSAVAMLSEATLRIGEIKKTELAADKQKTSIRAILAEVVSNLKESEMISVASASLYNMQTKQLIANSYEMAVTHDKGVIEWWGKNIESNSSTPIISLTDDAVNFLKAHGDCKIISYGYYKINSLIAPRELVAYQDNKMVASIELTAPTITSSTYNSESELLWVGNSSDETVYQYMKNYSIEQNHMGLFDTTYSDIDEGLLTKYSLTFCFDGVTYQLDCIYQVNFWNFIVPYLFLMEVIGLAVCALFAFISAKNSKQII